MKNKLQQFIVKLLAATLAIIMAVPTNVFAMSQRKSNTYTAATSVMGIQPKDDAPETETSQETNLLKSAVSTEETTDYIIEKSANLSQTTGQVTYKIAVKTKDPSQEFTENQTTTFGITENTDLKDLKVEKVQALDADGKEIDVKNTLNTPKAFNSTDNLRTLGITATKPQYGMVYYLSTQLTEEALKNLEEKSPQLALDITIASPNQDTFQTRYSLETTKIDTTEITIDNDGNVVNQTSELVEKEDNLHLYKGEYKKEEKTLFQTTPSHIVWTDYINAKDDKEFTLDFDLDENQDTENSQINIDYYEARDKGYVLNQSFSKTVDFTKSLNLTIPQGYIAKVSLTTAIKENKNAKEYTFNGVKVANPTYKEEKTEKTEEEQTTDDADPLPDDSSKNDEEAKPSNDSIADESKQDFSQNPKSDTSAIALNKEAYLENLKDEEKLTENLEKATNDIELALESYNKEETNWDEFKATIQTIAKEQNLDQAQTEETLQALLAGLNEDKYKVANIDTKEATNLVEESTDQSEPKDATEKLVDQLVKEKLNEEGITIEDFQNYMYELEEKYGLTDEDAARIYGDNAEAIQGLINKHNDENIDPLVLATIDANRHTIDRDWTEDEGLRKALNQYQLAIYGYGNPVVEDDNITSINWKVTYYSDKPLSTQGLLASITAVEGSGIDTDSITNIKVNGKSIDLEKNPADVEHGINDSYFSDLSNQGDLTEYKIEFSTPVAEKQDYYTLDFFGQYNNVDDSSLKDRKPRGSARLTSPGYINAQNTKDNPDTSYADNKQTVRGYYTDLVDGKPTKARWIVTDHVTTQNEQSLPFDTRNLTNQDLESLKVSFYTPDESGKLVKLGETEDLTNEYPLNQGSLFAHPPIGTIAVYEYVTKLQGDPYETEYALGDTKLGELTEEYTIKKEWQGITNGTEIPAIDVTLTGSDNITSVTTRLSGVLDQDRRETTKVNLPKWTISQNTEQGLDYSKIEYKVSEEKIGSGTNYTNLASNVIEHLKEIELVNKVVNKPTPGSLTIELLESNKNTPLDNVEFIISGPEIEKKARTGSDGKILFDKLPQGTYTLVQNESKQGYRKPENKGHIQVNSEGNITWTKGELIAKGTSESKNPTLTVYNDKLDNVEFKIKKIGKNGIALTGAKFELRDKNDNLVSSGTSVADGYINFRNVTAGQYTLKETQAPDGYDISDKVYDVTIDESNYIEIRKDGRVIAKGYPEDMNDGPSPSTETKVVVNKNELILDETGQAGGRAGVLDRYRFETLNYVLEMNVQNPKASDQFSIKFDDKLNIERNIGNPFPHIYDKDKNLVATFVNFNKATNELIYKFNPDYIKPGMDINIKYEVNGIRPDDYKVLNKYGEGQIAGRPGAKNWTFSTDLNYNGSSKDSSNFSVQIDMASGSDSLVYSSNNAIGSSVLDINRNEATRKPETFKEVFYINPVPGKDIGSFNSILLKFMTQSKSKGVNMSYDDIVSGYLPDKGFTYTGYRVYRVPNSQKYDLMPTSYGVDEDALKRYQYTSYKTSGMRERNYETIIFSNMRTTSSTDAFVIVVDFKVTNPDIVDNNFLANQVQKIGGSNESRGFFMGIGGASAKSNAVITSVPTPAPFSLEIPNERYEPGSFELQKKDSTDGKPLKDAIFTLYNENQTQVIDQKATKSDGKLSFTGLRPGTYKLVETKSPDGYVKKDQVASIIVGKDGKVAWVGNDLLDNQDFNIVDDRLEYRDISNKPGTFIEYSQYPNFMNAAYSARVTDASNKKVEYYILLNPNGSIGKTRGDTYLDIDTQNINITDVNYQKIANRSLSSVKNQVLDQNSNIAANNTESSYVSYEINGSSLKVTLDERIFKSTIETLSNSASGSEGILLKVSADIIDPTQESTIDFNWSGYYVENGQINRPELSSSTSRNGTSTKSTIGPIATVVKRETGQTKPSLSVTNKAKDYQVTIHKVDKDGTSLANASFALYDGLGAGANLIASSDQTDESGQLIFKNLEAGKDYYLKEDAAPQGYIKLDQVFKFSIDKNGRIINTQTLDQNGDLLETQSPYLANLDGIGTIRTVNEANEISFQKMAVSNLSENPLSGIEFTLKNTSDNSKVSTRSDENGKIRFEKIVDGDYELIETIPEPAIENNGIKTFTIDGKKYNAPSDGIVARFTVKDGQISSLKSWKKTTDATGSESVGLIDVDIDDFENTMVQIDNESGDTPTYPSTGGSGTFIGFALIGTAVMLAGIAYYGIYVNDKNRRRSNRYDK